MSDNKQLGEIGVLRDLFPNLESQLDSRGIVTPHRFVHSLIADGNAPEKPFREVLEMHRLFGLQAPLPFNLSPLVTEGKVIWFAANVVDNEAEYRADNFLFSYMDVDHIRAGITASIIWDRFKIQASENEMLRVFEDFKTKKPQFLTMPKSLQPVFGVDMMPRSGNATWAHIGALADLYYYSIACVHIDLTFVENSVLYYEPENESYLLNKWRNSDAD